MDSSFTAKFGLFAFHCVQYMYQHDNGDGTSDITNLSEVNVPKVIDSLHWCLNALIYDKQITEAILIRPLSY